MNLELLEQFGQNLPEEFDGTLDTHTQATVAAFNRRGSILAVGGNDGRVYLYDFMTRTVAKSIWAHVHAITSLSWSRNGRMLATSSNDCFVCVWNVFSGACIIQWHFSTIVFSVQFSPRNDKIMLIRRLKEPSILVQYTLNPDGQLHSKTHSVIPRDEESEFDVVASFDRRGEYVFSGNTKGRIQVLKLTPGTIEVTVITSFRVSNTAIKQIEFAPKDKDIFLVNSADRTIRVYSLAQVLATAQVNGSNHNQNNNKSRKMQGNNSVDLRVELEPIQKLQDLVNRTTWKKCCFSGGSESEFICAGSARHHSIYIWDRTTGVFQKNLTGIKGETINDVVWHPNRPVVVTIATGVVSIWAQHQVENWSAFAPEFKELEENIEYEERESEFDEFDEDRTPARVDQDDEEEETTIDVVTPHTIGIFLSSDEDEADVDELIYFPATVEFDDIESESNEENPFDRNISISVVPHKANSTNNSGKLKTDDGLKSLHPKNRNVPTINL